MIHLPLLLADVDGGDLISESHRGLDSRLLYSLAVFGSIALAALAAFAWALFYSLRRKKKKRHHHHHEQSRPATATATESPAAPAVEPNGADEKEPRRHRRSRRPMNPTLAETRGLPPMRDENTPLPPMP